MTFDERIQNILSSKNDIGKEIRYNFESTAMFMMLYMGVDHIDLKCGVTYNLVDLIKKTEERIQIKDDEQALNDMSHNIVNNGMKHDFNKTEEENKKEDAQFRLRLMEMMAGHHSIEERKKKVDD